MSSFLKRKMVAAAFIGVILIYSFSIQESLASSIGHGSSIDNQINEDKPIPFAENVDSGVDEIQEFQIDNNDIESKEATSSVFDGRIEAAVDPDFSESFENDYLDFNYCSVEMPTPSTEDEANQKTYFRQNSTDKIFDSGKKPLTDEHRVTGNLDKTHLDIELNNAEPMTVSGYTMDAGYSSVSIQKAAEVQAVEYCVNELPEDHVILQQNSRIKKEIYDIPHDDKEEHNLLEESLKNLKSKSVSLENLEESGKINIFADDHPMSKRNRIIKKSNATESFQQSVSGFENNILESSTISDTLILNSGKNSLEYRTNQDTKGLEINQTTKILNGPNPNHSRNNEIINKMDANDEIAYQNFFNGTKSFPKTDLVCENKTKSEVLTVANDFNIDKNKSSKDNATCPGKTGLPGDKTSRDIKDLNLKQECGHPESLSNNCSLGNTACHANIDIIDNIVDINGPKIKQNGIEIVRNLSYKVNEKINITEEKDQLNFSQSEEKRNHNVSLTLGSNAKINETKNKTKFNITNEQTHQTNPTNDTKIDMDENKPKPNPVKSEISQENEEQLDITTLLKIFTPEDVMSMLLNSRPKQERIPKPKVDPNTLPKHAIIRRDRVKQAIDIAKYTMEKYADLL